VIEVQFGEARANVTKQRCIVAATAPVAIESQVRSDLRSSFDDAGQRPEFVLG
jgi:hypothetical protein